MDSNKYLRLFAETFKISACTFGGGFVIIPLLRKKFVEELGWISEQEMMDYTAIAQSSPGAIAVNASILVGYHTAGFSGAITAVIATVLPPLMIISVISMFYLAFRDSRLVQIVMAGMLAGVAAVISDVVVSMTGDLLKRKKAIPILTMVLSFIAVRYLKINIIVIIFCCGILGALQTRNVLNAERERGIR